MRDKYARHQLKMARLGISIDNHNSLKNRLKQIKPRLQAAAAASGRWQAAWVRWSSSQECPPAQRYTLEAAVKAEHTQLHVTDTERYYRLLLERAGVTL